MILILDAPLRSFSEVTLIIAADVQDHLILAGDHCAVMLRVSNQGAPEVVLKNYRKMYPWKYGIVAASGDVFVTVWFCRLFLHHESTSRPIDLLQVAREAKQIRTRNGVPCNQSTGNIFLTLPGREGFDLYCVSIEADTIDYEIIEPITTQFSFGKGALDDPAYNAFNSCLRPSFYFQSVDAFHSHHLALLSAFFRRQSAIDELVTASFDAFMLDKRTGIGAFWQISETSKQIAYIDL
ncbi:hypothetical protein [Xanthomonas populi]|uniref:hypothetical protein n=1 Tax=Xanthomonas populi TaxID=53414 RepID=UPI0011B07803|nr:hypothetical protein [Xanthomonas populi]